MFNQRKATRSVILKIEQLEARLSPATLVTDRYGANNPPGATLPYNMSQVYTDNLPPGTTAAEFARGNIFQGANVPAAYITTLSGAQLEVDVEPAQDSQLTATFVNTLRTWNAALPQAQGWDIRLAQADPIADLTFTINSYQAYGSAFQKWIPSPTVSASTISPDVAAAIDVRTNLPAPGGVNNTPIYQWIQVVTTNYTSTMVRAGQAAGAMQAPFVDDGAEGRTSSPFHPGVDQRSLFDIPNRPNFTNEISWKAEAALVLREPGTNIINVYPDEFWWGWTVQPRVVPIERLRQVVLSGRADPATIVGTNLGQGGESTTMTGLLRVHRQGNQPTGTVAIVDTTMNTVVGIARGNTVGTWPVIGIRMEYDPVSGGAGQPHRIVFVYSGDAYYTGDVTLALTLTVTRPPGLPGGMGLNSSTNPAVAGGNTTLTATMTPAFPGGNTPTGSVAFFDGLTQLGTAALNGGVANFILNNLTAAVHNITAIYLGDQEYTSTTAFLDETVNDAGGSSGSQWETTTHVTSSAVASVQGQTVTLTASVLGADPDGDIPTGSVAFYDGDTELGTGMLDASGNASFSVSSLDLGGHNITAIYSGDTDFISSTGFLTQTVNEWNSATTLSTSAGSAVYGQSVTLTAAVSSSQTNTIPTGEVDFFAGTFFVGDVPLDSSGHASINVNFLSAGTSSITAVYVGDGNFNESTSTASTVAISQATPSVYVTAAGGTYNGSPFAATATVAGVVSGWDDTAYTSLEDVTPTVSYYIGSTASGTPLSGAPIQPGTYTAVASFPGSIDYTIASSSATFRINPPVVTLINPGNQFNHAGNAVYLQLNASASNGDSLTYTATGLPPGLSIDPLTGLISGTIDSSAGSLMPYSVTVTAFDTIANVWATQSFLWTVS